jgi:hypothetical protein
MVALNYGVGTGTIHVYTEDAVSAMKLGELNGVHTSAMCGTHANISALAADLKMPHVVWFDNDNPTVIEHAHNLAHALTNRGCRVVLIQGVQDPKKYTKSFLFEVLTDAHKLSRTTPPDDKPYHVLEVRPPNP